MKHQHRIPAQHHPKNALPATIQGGRGDQYPKLKPLLKAASSIPAERQNDSSCFVRGYN
ncbi:hypothetical protein NX722_04115 [Endozoicomonas gorgoniicola]|uniref:Uncharacterized protein n=1 Tax=Endozoicomonas gorgoniicola TaxID=1234144 RepID=A0ABT3MR48_9GAMM|nr:hypothetical protein [Endozoicomonas gorgoniicola]MCW7551837.1 hypothetical protein [Endozoicomonas gorgoniicola]